MGLNIAIVGLGRVGGEFLDEMLNHDKDGVKIVAVAEMENTSGKQKAQEASIPVRSMDEIVSMGNKIDILFDLTGNEETRKSLRELMAGSGNNHTIIAPEAIAYLLWTLATKKPLPDVHEHKGY